MRGYWVRRLGQLAKRFAPVRCPYQDAETELSWAHWLKDYQECELAPIEGSHRVAYATAGPNTSALIANLGVYDTKYFQYNNMPKSSKDGVLFGVLRKVPDSKQGPERQPSMWTKGAEPLGKVEATNLWTGRTMRGKVSVDNMARALASKGPTKRKKRKKKADADFPFELEKEDRDEL